MPKFVLLPVAIAVVVVAVVALHFCFIDYNCCGGSSTFDLSCDKRLSINVW